MRRSSRTLTGSIIRETVKRELGITLNKEVYGYGEKCKTLIRYSSSIFVNDGWHVSLEFYGKKGYIELSKQLIDEQELIELINYFKKLKKIR